MSLAGVLPTPPQGFQASAGDRAVWGGEGGTSTQRGVRKAWRPKTLFPLNPCNLPFPQDPPRLIRTLVHSAFSGVESTEGLGGRRGAKPLLSWVFASTVPTHSWKENWPAGLPTHNTLGLRLNNFGDTALAAIVYLCSCDGFPAGGSQGFEEGGAFFQLGLAWGCSSTL